MPGSLTQRSELDCHSSFAGSTAEVIQSAARGPRRSFARPPFLGSRLNSSHPFLEVFATVKTVQNRRSCRIKEEGAVAIGAFRKGAHHAK